MIHSTARRRGRHAAPASWQVPAIAIPRITLPRRPARTAAPIPETAPVVAKERAPEKTVAPRTAPVASEPRPARPIDGISIELPGMQLLGFDDDIESVYVEQPRASAAVAVASRPRPVAIQARSIAGKAAARVQDLWDTTDISFEALEKWAPNAVARRKLSPNAIRAGSWVWVGVGVVACLLLLWLFVARPNAVAAEADAALSSGAAETLAAIDPVKGVAASLASPEAPDLVDATEIIMQSESTARALFTSAGAVDASDEATLRRRDLAVNGAGGLLDSTTRINRLVAYRLSAEQALVAPDLPADSSSVDISALTARVAEWRAQVSGTIGGLPDNVLPEDTARLRGWDAELQQWQESYLDLAREGKVKKAEASLSEQTDRIGRLHSELLADLAVAAQSIDETLEAARTSLAGLLAG